MNDDAVSLVLVGDDGPVRTLTLNRPQARNAFDTALYAAAGSALDAADADDTVKVVILNGAGKGFSAGQDLKEMAALGDPATREASGDGDPAEHGFGVFINAIESFSKPLVAAVHGNAIGIGTTMLPYCDLVVVADDARLRLPFVPLGVVPEAGSSFTIPMVMGRQQASYLLLTGEWIDGPGAVAAGLALKCVPAADLLAEAGVLAAALAAGALSSLQATKRLIRAGWIDGARAARAREEAVFTTLLGHGASKDALDEFLAR
ncbi:MAG: enoyl-CoA hydratase/isomerase family protein [Acidimicrobiia bacterium]